MNRKHPRRERAGAAPAEVGIWRRHRPRPTETTERERSGACGAVARCTSPGTRRPILRRSSWTACTRREGAQRSEHEALRVVVLDSSASTRWPAPGGRSAPGSAYLPRSRTGRSLFVHHRHRPDGDLLTATGRSPGRGGTGVKAIVGRPGAAVATRRIAPPRPGYNRRPAGWGGGRALPCRRVSHAARQDGNRATTAERSWPGVMLTAYAWPPRRRQPSQVADERLVVTRLASPAPCGSPQWPREVGRPAR
jgi:hypothetical protein